MSDQVCKHVWEIFNERSGYLIVEGCYLCGGRISFFSAEPVPPMDDYREGDHYWSYVNSFQAMKFDLRCRECREEVHLEDVTALMLCTRCNPECDVFKESDRHTSKRAWIYVALCANTTHESNGCISQKGIATLNEYFNAGQRSPDKNMIVVPCNLRKSADKCQGIVLADTGLTELY
ncbi:MAG: hypothetical protein GY835_07835 [bacterium]|nr:hypothetical protein [bacterium]